MKRLRPASRRASPAAALLAIMAWTSLTGPPAAGAAATPDARARRILDAAGVRGGLVVHLGCGDGTLTAALAAAGNVLVHGLDTDPAKVRAAREHLRSLGLCGKATAAAWAGKRLPYVDNGVNLIVCEDRGALPEGEILRALAPGGVACTLQGATLSTTVKPWPDTIDEWTHFLHGPDNNAVAEDTQVRPPRHLQWVCGPPWGRSHEHLASLSTAVSTAGRLFYIVDEAPLPAIQAPAEWTLVARDAFSGVLLWKRQIGPWENHLRPFRSGPAELPRRLVAVGDRVYATLGYGQPVSALDAATGETVRTYEGTENTHEILCHDGRLTLVVSAPLEEESPTTGKVLRRFSLWRDVYAEYVVQYMPKHIRAVDAATGALLWKKDDDETRNILPLTLAASGGRVFFQNETHVVALEARSGQVAWRAERPAVRHRYAWLTPTLVVKDGVVISADRAADKPVDTGGGDPEGLEWRVSANHILTGGQMMAFAAEDGRPLWTAPCHEGFNSPVDVFIAHGKVWSGVLAWPQQPGITDVYDLHTGKVVHTRPPDRKTYSIGFGHSRCHRNKATTQYIIQGRNGVEFLDMTSDRVVSYYWVRGMCQYGILPCNGLLYVPPHPCACHIEGKLNHFNALAARAQEEPAAEEAPPRLERGPAFQEVSTAGLAPPDPRDWPTYRHDGQRSGVAGCPLPAHLRLQWDAPLPGPLTSLVVAEDTLFLAQPERHTVVALDASDGSPRWHHTAGGRVDSPPTFYGGFVYFGSADGSITCLRARDAALAWRFRAAPRPRYIVSYDQMESLWPVHGTVLVHPPTAPSSPPSAYAVAGRSSFLDGGMLLYRLDARSGAVLAAQRLDEKRPALPDILSTDGESVFLRHLRFDLACEPKPTNVPHLFSPAGFLDDTWWHRTYWQVGTKMFGGYGGWQRAGNHRISGRLLVVPPGDRVFGFGRKKYSNVSSHLESAYHLFAADVKLVRPKASEDPKERRRRRRGPHTRVRTLWAKELPFYPRAMVLAGDTLFAAGPRHAADFTAPRPKGDVSLWAISPADGSRQAATPLPASPVFDSIAVADGRLFLATVNGRVLCFSARDE